MENNKSEKEKLPCPMCGGSGRVVDPDYVNPTPGNFIECPLCHGTGLLWRNKK